MTSADAGSWLAGIRDANSVGPTVSTSLWLTGGWVEAAIAGEPRRYGMVPASEVTHLRAEVARLTAIIETMRAPPEPVAAPHPVLRAIQARPGNYGLAGLAN